MAYLRYAYYVVLRFSCCNFKVFYSKKAVDKFLKEHGNQWYLDRKVRLV